MPQPLLLPNARSAPARRAALRAGVAAAAVCAAGCGEVERLTQVPELYRVVSGEPDVTRDRPSLDLAPASDPALGPSRPRFCEAFAQARNRKVDVLWVIDSSASMAQEQERLAAAIPRFFERLADGDDAVDFQLGVITTDVDRVDPDHGIAPGRLREPVGADRPFLRCERPSGGTLRCNVGDGALATAIDGFRALLRVGTDGSPEEKGLLAAMLALSEPMRGGANAGFLRDDAALAIVFVSDENDSSCGPYVDDTPCLAAPSCKCEDSPTWGSLEYFGRFFRGLKGPGNEAAVRIGSLTATTETMLSFSDQSGRTYAGCSSDASQPCAVPGQGGAECAFHAPRYVALAEATGGFVADLCDASRSEADFGSALERLGLSVSGLRTDFALGRSPVPGTIDVALVQRPAVSCNDASPCKEPFPICVRGQCARPVPEGVPDGWEHVVCSGGTDDSVRFGGQWIPGSSSTIEVCYDVEADPSLCQ